MNPTTLLLHEQLEALKNLIKAIETEHLVRIEDLEYETQNLRALLEQLDTQIRNIRNEG